jgi:dihydroorotase
MTEAPDPRDDVVAPQSEFDVVVKGGRVIDPAVGLDEQLDVGFAGGRLRALEPEISAARASTVIDASNAIVVAGLVDLHGHYFASGYPFAVPPDAACLPHGVTTAVDAGTSGWVNFPAFRKTDMQATVRLFALLNVCALGLTPRAAGVPELSDMRFAQVEQAVQAIRDNRDVVVGVKARATTEASSPEDILPALAIGRRIADEAGGMLMLHLSGSPVAVGDLLTSLRSGDVVTHCFHGRGSTILDDRGRVRADVRAARAEGVLFDVGHAGFHCAIDIARRALAEGFAPDTLSSDAFRFPGGADAPTLTEVMTVFLALGMSLNDVVAAVTCRPADVLGRAPGIGRLVPGVSEDAAVIAVRSRRRTLHDQDGGQVESDIELEAVCTVRAGRVVHSVVNDARY